MLITLFRKVWYNKNFVDEISLIFPELFIIGKYVKNRFKRRGSPCYFLSTRAQKIKKYYKHWIKEILFVCILGFIFNGASCAKTDLHNKYMI